MYRSESDTMRTARSPRPRATHHHRRGVGCVSEAAREGGAPHYSQLDIAAMVHGRLIQYANVQNKFSPCCPVFRLYRRFKKNQFAVAAGRPEGWLMALQGLAMGGLEPFAQGLQR
jgi:hypothetical protein